MTIAAFLLVFVGFIAGFLLAAFCANCRRNEEDEERLRAAVGKAQEDDTLGIVEIVDDCTIKEVKHV